MQVWMVQVVVGEKFRDTYLTAESAEAAVKQARMLATDFERRWASFIA